MASLGEGMTAAEHEQAAPALTDKLDDHILLLTAE